MRSRAVYVRFLRHMEQVDPDKKWLKAFETRYQAARDNDSLDGGTRAADLVAVHWIEADRIGRENMLENTIDRLTQAIRKSLPGESL